MWGLSSIKSSPAEGTYEMTNDQCIQVAGLWGWTLRKDGWYQPTTNLDWPLGLKVCTESGIKSEVNSWSGFGRTVEAMFQKRYWFEPAFCTEHKYDCISFVHETLASYPIHYKRDCSEDLIEATHLAALEAVREGK